MIVTEPAQDTAEEGAGSAPAGRATAVTQREPKPTASAGGSRELLIPGRTVRSPVVTGSAQAGAGPDRSGMKPTATDGSDDRGTPDPGRTVRRIPPRQATPLRQADIGSASQAVTPPPWRAAPETGIISRAEPPPVPPPAAAQVPAPQIVVTLPPRTPPAPLAFWERRHLGRLWSRPLR